MSGKFFVRLALTAGLIFLLAGKILAHGTGYRQSSLEAVAFEFMYSTGEAMSYREARVFSPKDEKFAYQSGRTDENGRFSFVPDTAGKWRVIVRDEEGHQCTAEIDITPQNEPSAVTGQPAIPDTYEMIIRSLLGVSIIFNIALIVRSRRHAH